MFQIGYYSLHFLGIKLVFLILCLICSIVLPEPLHLLHKPIILFLQFPILARILLHLHNPTHQFGILIYLPLDFNLPLGILIIELNNLLLPLKILALILLIKLVNGIRQLFPPNFLIALLDLIHQLLHLFPGVDVQGFVVPVLLGYLGQLLVEGLDSCLELS